MSKFFKDHYEKVLVVSGILFLLAVVLVFIWSISFLSGVFGNIFNPSNNGDQAIRFNIEEAKKLNLNVGE